MMTAQALFEAIRAYGGEVSGDTVDTCKAGALDKAVKKLAVCFIATPAVLQAAAAWGADMLLTHEPTYYTNDDTADTDAVTTAKKELVAQTGMTICRFHDGIHAAAHDLIVDSFTQQARLIGTAHNQKYLTLTSATTPNELAKQIAVRCGLRHVRVVGAAHTPVTKLALHVGAPYTDCVMDDLKKDRADCVVIGEVCEWAVGEYVRDAAQFGLPKSLIITGHVGAERDGMRRLAEILESAYVGVETRYFECEELYL